MSSWSAEAAHLVDKACERHGGLATWKQTPCLTLQFAELSGLLPWMKGYGATFQLPSRLHVYPHERRTVFDGYPDQAHVGVFDGDGSARIHEKSATAPRGRGADHRGTFGLFSRNRRWQAVDALYFFGYAVLHYHSLPFTLMEAELLATGRYSNSDGEFTTLRVRFPQQRITHCAVQTFHFDAGGLVVRHDYTADIIGPWARGAHLWRDYREVNGLQVAMHRRVVVRLGSKTLPIVALEARLASPSPPPRA